MENTVIINSIGTASPKVSKVLSEAFKIPQDFMLKLLYTAPSVLFQKVDNTLAIKAEETLTKLGLDVSILNEDETLDISKELVDVSIYFENILNLPTVLEQLSNFLGCKPAEALNLLLKQPSIVLGEVSAATAQALEKRINASVCYSNPKTDLFTISITKETPKNIIKNIERRLGKTAISNANGSYTMTDVTYSECASVWRETRDKEHVSILNQTHQLASVELTAFDSKNEKQAQFLISKVGIPSEILSEIETNLPICLFDNISAKQALAYQEECEIIGMSLNINKETETKKHLKVSAIKQPEAVVKVLSQFIDATNLTIMDSWQTETPLPSLITRYLHKQLEQLDCNPEII
jgi:hypothetical protein